MMIRNREESNHIPRNAINSDSMERKRKIERKVSKDDKKDEIEERKRRRRESACVSLKVDQLAMDGVMVKSASLDPDVVPFSKSDSSHAIGKKKGKVLRKF